MALRDNSFPRSVHVDDGTSDGPSSAARFGPAKSMNPRDGPHDQSARHVHPALEKQLPNSWTETIQDRQLWVELRELLLGFE